jgi:hypothetical protein
VRNTGAAISCAADLHLVAIGRGAVGLAAGTGVHEQLHVELDGPRAFLAGTLVLLAVFRGRVHANHRERVLVHVPRPLGLGQACPTRVAQVVVAGLVAPSRSIAQTTRVERAGGWNECVSRRGWGRAARSREWAIHPSLCPPWRPLTLQFHRMPEVMSWWQYWHCDTKLGASGLCRWYRTIIDECFARRKKSYW